MKITARHLMPLLASLALALAACGGDDDKTADPVTPVTPTPDPNPDPEPATPTACQGWPENYGGVMLQAFWWDSYAESRWTTLTAQADELAQYFQLVWVPNSGKTSDYAHSGRQTMGYDPCYWLDHTSCWGTEAELRQMIAAFRQRGTAVIEDVVINHKNGLNSWVDFPDETNGTYSLTWDNTSYTAICRTDECNQNGYHTTGAADTGDNFEGYRDLDHTNAQVQRNVGTYLQFLLSDLGYGGFRYDMVKGYAPRYVGQYNALAQPAFSVGECWDASKQVVATWLNGTRQDGQIQSAAFDFPLKYKLNNAFSTGSWGLLSTVGNTALATDAAYQRYAVTFVDNHDTYRENTRLQQNVCAANAYILCLPGTPCLFLKHWQQYRGTLKRLITLRRIAGINNQSSIVRAATQGGAYVLTVQGTKGQLMLILGNTFSDTGTYQLALTGHHFAVYASSGLDLSPLDTITDTDADAEDAAATVIPGFCTVADGETCAFFEAPAAWGSTVKCWAWTDTANYTGGTWPGADCTLAGTADNGRKVWKWTYNGTLATPPAYIIFNDGQSQTADLPYTNGGYYTLEGLQGTVSAN